MNPFVRFWRWWNRPNKTTFEEYFEAIIVIVPLAFIIRTWGYGLYQVPTGSMETTMLIGESYFSDKLTYNFRNPRRGEIISCNEPTFRYSSNSLVRLWEKYVWGPQNWTKRIIGVPGDRVQGVIENGKPVVYLNDKKLNEPYLNTYPLIPILWESALEGSYRSYDPNYSYEDQPFYQMNRMTVRSIQRTFAEHGLPVELRPGTPTKNGSDVFDVHLKDNQYWLMGDNRLGSYDSRAWGPLDGDRIHGRIVFRLFSVDSSKWSIIWDMLTRPLSFLKRVRWSRFLQPVH